MRSTKLPNLFIVGAPRSGTTALHEALAQHPQVFMPWVKEPHYFASDLRSPWHVSDASAYQALFVGANGAPVAGDSSTRYLQSRTAAAAIHEFNPNARIIAMLRNPVDQTYSLHGHLLFFGYEPIEDFEDALAAEPRRLHGEPMPNGFPSLAACYRDCATYAPQLRRYFDQFGRDAVHVLIFDDFSANAGSVVKETCAFLGLDDDFQFSNCPVNAQRTPRTALFRRLPLQRSPRARRLIRAIVPRAIRQSILRLVAVERPRPPLPPELRLRMQNDFLPGVEDLSALLDRDLTHWCRE